MKTLIIAALFFLAACGEYHAAISERGAQAADDALAAAQWAHCKSATAAAVERRYQVYTNPNGPQAKAWRELCYGADEPVESEVNARPVEKPTAQPRIVEPPWGYTDMCKRNPEHELCPR